MIMQWTPASPAEFERLRALEDADVLDWIDDATTSFDVDWAWHGVHFTLTGEALAAAGPLGTAVFGGVEFGGDLGFGPARWLDESRVAEFSDALVALGVDGFRRRIDFALLTERGIYPNVWHRDPVRERFVPFLTQSFETLSDAFTKAASLHQGMIVVLSE